MTDLTLSRYACDADAFHGIVNGSHDDAHRQWKSLRVGADETHGGHVERTRVRAQAPRGRALGNVGTVITVKTKHGGSEHIVGAWRIDRPDHLEPLRAGSTLSRLAKIDPHHRWTGQTGPAPFEAKASIIALPGGGYVAVGSGDAKHKGASPAFSIQLRPEAGSAAHQVEASVAGQMSATVGQGHTCEGIGLAPGGSAQVTQLTAPPSRPQRGTKPRPAVMGPGAYPGKVARASVSPDPLPTLQLDRMDFR